MTNDVHQQITDTLIAKMEEGVLPWRQEWTGSTGIMQLPRRVTGETYQGINVLLLWIAAAEKGFAADQWMTFNQAKKLGANVRKGERGTKIVFYKTLEIEDENGEDRKIPMARTFTVFNVEQIDNLPAEYTPAPRETVDTGARGLADLDAFFQATGAAIAIDGQQPHYRPSSDSIHMPAVSTFTTAAAYYATLAHELVHWTGHKSRLDRFGENTKPAYAFEELVAELGACFLCASLGLAPDLDNSAAYLASWLRALKDDKRFIFRAAAAAQKATDFLLAAASQESETAAA